MVLAWPLKICWKFDLKHGDMGGGRPLIGVAHDSPSANGEAVSEGVSIALMGHVRSLVVGRVGLPSDLVLFFLLEHVISSFHIGLHHCDTFRRDDDQSHPSK